VRSEGGFTLVELVVTMAILGVVMAGITGLFVSGTRAQGDLQARFDAQTELLVGVDKIRRELHSACSVATSSTSSVTFNLPSTGCATTTSVTWCTQGSGSRYGLYRVVGSSCTGGTRYADFLINGGVFSFLDKNTTANGVAGSYALPRLRVDFTVDGNAADIAGRYHVQDDIVFRNGGRI
jgi:prepilin-type N-terminal cleavage/methylation domain-containing protein